MGSAGYLEAESGAGALAGECGRRHRGSIPGKQARNKGVCKVHKHGLLKPCRV